MYGTAVSRYVHMPEDGIEFDRAKATYHAGPIQHQDPFDQVTGSLAGTIKVEQVVALQK